MPRPVKPRPTSPQGLPETPPQVLPPGRLLSIREAAPLLSYARQTLFNSFWSGTGVLAELPIYRMGRNIRIAESDIVAFLASKRVDPGNGR